MSTMTLEQVRDWHLEVAASLRKSEVLCRGVKKHEEMADAIAAHLRERESAKAGVTDAIVSGALFDFLGYLTSRDDPVTFSSFHEAGHAVRVLEEWALKRALFLDDADVEGWKEAVTPMLASGFNLPQKFVDRGTTDGEDEPPCLGAGAVNDLQELANEVEACWLCASNGDGEITLETINNWSGRLSKMVSAWVPDEIRDDDPRQFLGWSDKNVAYRAGWNQCRAAMLAAAPKRGRYE